MSDPSNASGLVAPSEAIRVLVIDDHPIVIEGIRQLFDDVASIDVVGVADEPEAAIALARTTPADVAIVDLSLPGIGGFELIRRLRTVRADLDVVVLTIHAQRTYVERAFRAGATGFVTKSDGTDALLEAVETVASGGRHLSPAAPSIPVGALEDVPPTPDERLSDREIEVFRMIGEGRATREIAEMLGRSVKTIEAHREHIKKKLRLRDGAELLRAAIHWVWERGRTR